MLCRHAGRHNCVVFTYSLPHVRLCRTKKKAQGEGNATAISSLLPFLEYELHTQLMNKLKLRGMNALFGLRIQISVGETMLLGLAVSLLLPTMLLSIYCIDRDSMLTSVYVVSSLPQGSI